MRLSQFTSFASIFIIITLIIFISCNKDDEEPGSDTTDLISIDSLSASLYTVKAWDTTTITCYASGKNLKYAWECDHGNFNGEGMQIKYAAGECCVGLNTILCSISNEFGHVTKSVQIEVKSYFGGGK